MESPQPYHHGPGGWHKCEIRKDKEMAWKVEGTKSGEQNSEKPGEKNIFIYPR